MSEYLQRLIDIIDNNPNFQKLFWMHKNHVLDEFKQDILDTQHYDNNYTTLREQIGMNNSNDGDYYEVVVEGRKWLMQKVNDINPDLKEGTDFAKICEYFGCTDRMDTNNQNVIEVARTQGMSAAIQHMFTEPTTGRNLTYSEMRYLYG